MVGLVIQLIAELPVFDRDVRKPGGYRGEYAPRAQCRRFPDKRATSHPEKLRRSPIGTERIAIGTLPVGAVASTWPTNDCHAGSFRAADIRNDDAILQKARRPGG